MHTLTQINVRGHLHLFYLFKAHKKGYSSKYPLHACLMHLFWLNRKCSGAGYAPIVKWYLYVIVICTFIKGTPKLTHVKLLFYLQFTKLQHWVVRAFAKSWLRNEVTAMQLLFGKNEKIEKKCDIIFIVQRSQNGKETSIDAINLID